MMPWTDFLIFIGAIGLAWSAGYAWGRLHELRDAGRQWEDDR